MLFQYHWLQHSHRNKFVIQIIFPIIPVYAMPALFQNNWAPKIMPQTILVLPNSFNNFNINNMGPALINQGPPPPPPQMQGPPPQQMNQGPPPPQFNQGPPPQQQFNQGPPPPQQFNQGPIPQQQFGQGPTLQFNQGPPPQQGMNMNINMSMNQSSNGMAINSNYQGNPQGF